LADDPANLCELLRPPGMLLPGAPAETRSIDGKRVLDLMGTRPFARRCRTDR